MLAAASLVNLYPGRRMLDSALISCQISRRRFSDFLQPIRELQLQHSMDAPLRILVVDDSAIYRKIVRETLSSMPGVEVVGVAANGQIALNKIAALHPDLITLDLEMPVLDGLGLLKQLRLNDVSVGVIILSALSEGDARSTVTGLAGGAFDFVVKPTSKSLEDNAEEIRRKLANKIEAFRRQQTGKSYVSTAPSAAASKDRNSITTESTVDRMRRIVSSSLQQKEIVAIGVSTGGPVALSKMLPKLPSSLSVPVVVVQHMPAVFTQSLAEGLDRECQLSVCEAHDGQALQSGYIYIAPGGRQMKVERDEAHMIIRITDDAPENSCRPSVDYLFRSVVELYGVAALGVIMTGMGSDGAEGCRQLKRAGGAVIAQDEESCVVFGMPRQPTEEGIADVISPLGDIANHIVELVGQRNLQCK